MTCPHPLFRNFKDHVQTDPGNVCVSNLKSIAVTVLELLAFNALTS